MGKTIIYVLRATGHRCACEQWETVGAKIAQGQLWKVMFVGMEEGKKNIYIFFSM
jgi:hypothetical protein